MKLRVANCGKCLKRNILKKDYARFPFPNGCEEWEEQSSPLQKYKRVVEYAVERMENEFSELKAILNIDPERSVYPLPTERKYAILCP